MYCIYRESDEYYNDGDDRVREAEQQEKKERMAVIKQQFALRRGKKPAGSASSSMKNRLKEQKEKEKAEQQEMDRAKRSKLTSAEFTSKIVGLNVAVSFLKRHAQYV